METNPAGKQERYRGDSVSLAQRVHGGFSHVLLLPAGQGRLGHLLKRRAGTEVHGLETRADCIRTARLLLDSVTETEWGKGPLPLAPGHFDAAVVRDFHGDRAAFLAGIETLGPRLSKHSFLYLLVSRQSADTVAQWLDMAGWECFGSWPAQEDTPTPEDVLLVFVSKGYALDAHVRVYLMEGRHEAAYELLTHLPPQQEHTPEAKCAVETARLHVLAEWLREHPAEDPVPFFCQGMRHFRGAVEAQRYHRPAYTAMAALWMRLGEPERGEMLLRSLEYVQTGVSAPRSQTTLTSRPTPQPPSWTPDEWKPRILFVLPPQPHYGLDVVYHGLCKLLGADRVADFPWKPTLHGARPQEFANYPCMFDWPGTALSLEAVLEQVRAGLFDLVLYGDCESTLDAAVSRALAETLGSTPLFLFDASDEPVNRRYAVEETLGGVRAAGYFKREMLTCVDYGPNSFPMPFAYPEERALDLEIGGGEGRAPARLRPGLPTFGPAGARPSPPPILFNERDQDVFWAGHRGAYLRPLYLELVEQRLGRSFDGLFPPHEYAERLRRSRIGLNLFGYGFDTVRYWELPAQGCLMLSERPPIQIPHNFVDGEHALFFDDAQELDEKLAYYREHSQEAKHLARAGHAHFWKHHTASARAAQLLGWIRSVSIGRMGVMGVMGVMGCSFPYLP